MQQRDCSDLRTTHKCNLISNRSKTILNRRCPKEKISTERRRTRNCWIPELNSPVTVTKYQIKYIDWTLSHKVMLSLNLPTYAVVIHWFIQFLMQRLSFDKLVAFWLPSFALETVGPRTRQLLPRWMDGRQQSFNDNNNIIRIIPDKTDILRMSI